MILSLLLACAETSPGCEAGLTPGCTGGLIERWGVDAESFEGSPQALDQVLVGLHDLELDPGPVEWTEDPEGRWRRPPTEAIDALEELLAGGRPADVAADAIERLAYDPWLEDGWVEGAYAGGELLVVNPYLRGDPDLPKLASLFFHLGTLHGAGATHDIDCAEGTYPRDPDGCDSSWAGPYGMQAAWEAHRAAACWTELDQRAGEMVPRVWVDARDLDVDRFAWERCVQWSARVGVDEGFILLE